MIRIGSRGSQLALGIAPLGSADRSGYCRYRGIHRGPVDVESGEDLEKTLVRGGRPFKVDQTNNSYIFPGVGLGVIAVRARRLTDTMFMAAAKALAALSPARNDTGSNLLPPVTALREVSIAVARASAFQARKEGLTDLAEDKIDAAIHAKMWSPKYLPYRRTRSCHDD